MAPGLSGPGWRDSSSLSCWLSLACRGRPGYLLTSPGKLLWAPRGAGGLALLLGPALWTHDCTEVPSSSGLSVLCCQVCLARLSLWVREESTLYTGGSKSLLHSCRVAGPPPPSCILRPWGGFEWDLQTPIWLISGLGLRSDCSKQTYLCDMSLRL